MKVRNQTANPDATIAAPIAGMPYVPGSMEGWLRRGPAQAAADAILLLEQHQVADVRGEAAGFVVVEGAPLSHALIGLLDKGRPTIIVSAAQAATMREGCWVCLDGYSGLLRYGDPTRPAQTQPVVDADPAARLCSADGVAVHLRASVRSPESAGRAVAAGAESIGLVRSEFLVPAAGVAADSAFYTQSFAAVCQAAAPRPVTIRLLDVAADKALPGLPQSASETGVLGRQGVRSFDTEPVRSLVRDQLAAIDALASRYQLRLIIPYLTRFEELCHWRDTISDQLAHPVPIGAMIETPAAALDLAHWLTVADFAAVGCNDLMQCLFAADRDRYELHRYLDPYSPVLYRFMSAVADSVRGEDLGRVQLCGVLPQLPGVLPLLLGLGYRAFSVDAAWLPWLRQMVRTTEMVRAQKLARQVCEARESVQVTALVEAAVRDIGSG